MVMLGREMAMNQTCYGLTSKAKTPFALYCQLREGMDAMVHAAHGSVFDTITTSTFQSARFVLPPAGTAAVFERLVTPLFMRVLSSSEESCTLAALRDRLLPKLISGELRLKDVERFAERAQA
jgi:type I restriction enzyme S subunit